MKCGCRGLDLCAEDLAQAHTRPNYDQHEGDDGQDDNGDGQHDDGDGQYDYDDDQCSDINVGP